MHRRISVLTLFCMLVLSIAFNQVQAKAKNISSIVLNYTDDTTKKAVKGVSFSLSKVATGTDNRYKVTKAYQKVKFTLASDQTLQNIQIAKQLAKVTKKGTTKTTNKKGQVTFNKLQPGVYLIRQTKAVKATQNYQKIEPFLVYVTPSTKKVSYDLTAIVPVTMPTFG